MLALRRRLAGLFRARMSAGWGVDIGATRRRGVRLYAMGGALAVRTALRTRVFPADWSLAERRAWVGLLFLTLIVVSYR